MTSSAFMAALDRAKFDYTDSFRPFFDRRSFLLGGPAPSDGVVSGTAIIWAGALCLSVFTSGGGEYGTRFRFSGLVCIHRHLTLYDNQRLATGAVSDFLFCASLLGTKTISDGHFGCMEIDQFISFAGQEPCGNSKDSSGERGWTLLCCTSFHGFSQFAGPFPHWTTCHQRAH